MTANQHHQIHLYAYQQQQLQAVAQYAQNQQAQAITSNGSPANVNAVRSPMVQNSQITGNVARPGPLNGNTTQTSRSPMPPAQQPSVVAVQHPQQPATVQQMQSQQMYNYAANPYITRMTALHAMHNQQAQQARAQQQAQQQAQAQSQPQQPPQTPQMQAPTPEQQQAHAQAHAQAQALQMMSGYHMFNMNYAQMGLPMQGRIPPGYQWQTMGVRRPVNSAGVNGMNVNMPVNGQAAQMQAAQQMQRAMQGSVQGR